MTTVTLGAAAAWYAQVWPVFPLQSRGKTPLTRHGFKDASQDLDDVAAWWRRWPEANIGTPTGEDGCGCDVIDVDGRTGIASLGQIRHSRCLPGCCDTTTCAAVGPLPAELGRVWTPGSDDGPGRHLYVAPIGRPNGASIGVGIDYRGAGGYVVIPPSVGANGERYTWVSDEMPWR